MKVAYIYDETIGLHSYGKDHPMNPFRIHMTHSLVKSFKLDNKMDLNLIKGNFCFGVFPLPIFACMNLFGTVSSKARCL